MKKNLPVVLLKGLVLIPHNEIRLEFDMEESKTVIETAEYFHNNEVFIINEDNKKVASYGFPQMGVISKIVNKIKLPNGNLQVIIRGLSRATVIEYINAEQPENIEVLVKKFEEVALNKEQEKKLLRQIYSDVEFYVQNIPYINNKILEVLEKIDSVSKLTDMVAAFLPLSHNRAMIYMMQTDPEKRAKMILEDILKEKEKLNIEKAIDVKVKSELDKHQKEYILREKLKAIKEELGEASSKEDEIAQLRERLLKLKAPQRIKDRIQAELKRYEMLPPTSPEVHIVSNYIDWLMNIPWQKKTKDNENLVSVEKQLDCSHFGLEKVKTRILEFLAVKQKTKSLRGPILCLVGPPGVGKTSLAFSIADAIKRKFVKMSVGGVNDEAELIGHRRAYLGSSPGRIIQGIKKVGSANPLFLIDEIDKMTKDIKGDPASVLLEVLDPEKNQYFSDNYIEEAVDLSDVMFITTANHVDSIPDALRDRLEVINLAGYTEYEKLYIAKNHLLPQICEKHGLNIKRVSLSDNVILEIINNYTREAGVRELERQLSQIVRKIVYDIVINKKEKNYKVASKSLIKYLGQPKYFSDEKELKKDVGIVNGLVYTYFGGDIIPIEVNLYKGDGELVLTGSLGEVMKESAQISLGYIKSNHKKYNIDYNKIIKNNIHIHVPEGAVKKDGPSAGIAITTAMISVLGNYEVPCDVAMTGEITLRGKILSIGGLKEKSIGALRSKIKKIIIPIGNNKDIDEIPQEVKSKISYVSVKNYEEIFDILFKVKN